MRTLLGVAFLVVTSVAAFTYRDLILNAQRTVQRPEVRRPPPLAARASVPAPPLTATVDSLSALNVLVDSLMATVQEAPSDPRPMTELAFFYMKHGWFDRAVGPLARARELDSSSEPLRRYLELAVARSGQGYVDLNLAAAEFVEMMESWGMGC